MYDTRTKISRCREKLSVDYFVFFFFFAFIQKTRDVQILDDIYLKNRILIFRI